MSCRPLGARPPGASVTLTCDTVTFGTTVSAPTGLQTSTVTVSDPGNPATPAASQSTDNLGHLNHTINVRDVLAFSLNIDPPPNAVFGRTYGAPARSPLIFAATAGTGLSPYSWTQAGPLPGGVTCTPVSPMTSATLTCDSGGANVTGTTGGKTFTVTLSDTPNATTPSASTSTDNLTHPNHTITVNAVLAITTTSLPNRLLGFTYNPTGPGFTLMASGGLPVPPGALTWVAPGATSAPCPVPTGLAPFTSTGLSLAATTGVLSDVAAGTASALTSDFTFQVCVHDTANATTPAGFALPPSPPLTGNAYVVNVIGTLAYVAIPLTGNAEVGKISTSPGSSLSTIALGVAGTPDSVAITPDGRFAYVTLNATNQFARIDTITNAVTVSAALTGCTGPLGITAGQTLSGGRAYIACNTSNSVAVINTATHALVTTILSVGATVPATATPTRLAITPDGTRVYVTDSTNKQFIVIATSNNLPIAGSPFPFAGTCTTPRGIAIRPDGLRAFVACSGNGQLHVINTTFNTDIAQTALGTPPATATPDSVAVLPDGSRVYVTIPNLNEFSVVDATGSTIPPFRKFVDFNLPDPTVAAAAVTPIGVTIPPLVVPVPATGFRVFIVLQATSQVDVIDDKGLPPAIPAKSTAPLTNPIPVGTGAGLAPRGIAHIPPPK
jgi:DNA-binding beta-propeller fold protein YncE